MYVVVEVGETGNVYGVILIPLTVTGVVPSVYVNDQGGLPVKVTVSVAVSPHANDSTTT